jgi:hypothetical protein
LPGARIDERGRLRFDLDFQVRSRDVMTRELTFPQRVSFETIVAANSNTTNYTTASSAVSTSTNAASASTMSAGIVSPRSAR